MVEIAPQTEKIKFRTRLLEVLLGPVEALAIRARFLANFFPAGGELITSKMLLLSANGDPVVMARGNIHVHGSEMLDYQINIFNDLRTMLGLADNIRSVSAKQMLEMIEMKNKRIDFIYFLQGKVKQTDIPFSINGETRWVKLYTPGIKPNGYIYFGAIDITEAMEVAQVDSLTGLASFARFQLEISSIDTSAPYTIFNVDINWLKVINDTYGHEAGDRLIIRTAEILRKSFERGDVVCRKGGDEFLILVRNCNYETADVLRRRIEKVRQELNKTHKLANIHEITFAVGYASNFRNGQLAFADTYQVMHYADERMYTNKAYWHERLEALKLEEAQKVTLDYQI